MENSRVRNRRCKSISTKIYEEEGYTLSNILFVQYNMNTDNMSTYDAINFRGKRCEFIPICKGFSRPRRMRKSSEIVKNKIRELIENDRDISSNEIRRVTGYGISIINRYYMTLKKIYGLQI